MTSRPPHCPPRCTSTALQLKSGWFLPKIWSARVFPVPRIMTEIVKEVYQGAAPFSYSPKLGSSSASLETGCHPPPSPSFLCGFPIYSESAIEKRLGSGLSAIKISYSSCLGR